MRAVPNAGPIIHLSWIDKLNLLHQLFDDVLIPAAVRDEVLRASPDVPGVAAIRAALEVGRLEVRDVSDPSAAAQLRAELDEGEAEAIALMEELRADVLLLDDRRARAQVVARGMPITGTLGFRARPERSGRVLVTQDGDFVGLHRSQYQHAGIAYSKRGSRAIGQLVAALVLI